MTRCALFATALALVACPSPKPEQEAGAEPAALPSSKPSVPVISMSDQRGLKRGPSVGASDPAAGGGVLPSRPGATDGSEIDAGVGFREEARKGCSDQKCVGDACTRLCAAWTNQNPPKADDVKNKAYFGCIGSCLQEVDK